MRGFMVNELTLVDLEDGLVGYWEILCKTHTILN